MPEFTRPGLLTDRETVPRSLSRPRTSPGQGYAMGTMLDSAMTNARRGSTRKSSRRKGRGGKRK